MRMRWFAALAVFVSVLLVVAACGTDDMATQSAASAAGQAPQPSAAAGQQPPATQAGSPETTEGTQPMTAKQWNQAPQMQLEAGKDYFARLKTSMGDIVVDLYEQDAPVTVNNFVFLAQQGFYANVPFHRIVKGFVIQTGDPTGTGSGGPGYKFSDEPVTRDYTKGTMAMANAGPNTNGSQFFICLSDLSGRLPKNYTIFGGVTEGMDVVDAIGNVPTKVGPSGEQSSPVNSVTLESVEIFTK